MESTRSIDMVESLIIEDLEYIAQQFESTFTECIANVKKPNVLGTSHLQDFVAIYQILITAFNPGHSWATVSGVTGAGKSSLVNAIFGEGMAKVPLHPLLSVLQC